MKRIIFILFSLAICSYGRAQLVDTTRYITEDGYIEVIKTNFGIKVSLDNTYETFRVDTEANDISIYPNITSVMQFGVSYRFIRGSFGWAPSWLPGNGDEDIKGKTKAFGFALSMAFSHWFQELGYTKVQGYYLENTSDYDPNWSDGDPYIQVPDLHYKGFSGTTGYCLNPRLSLKSLTLQTERQLRSTGSFIAFTHYRYYIIDDRSGGATSQKSNNVEWGIGPGYVYNFVLKERFYASLGFMPSLGLVHTKLTTRYPDEEYTSRQNNFAVRWNGRAAIGYNGRIFFSGFYINYSGMTYEQDNTTAVNHDNRMFYQFFAGFRIRSPKWLNRTFDKLSPAGGEIKVETTR
jgi:hypothetical protein